MHRCRIQSSLLFIAVAVLVSATSRLAVADYGCDISDLLSQEEANCVKQSTNFTFFVVRAYRSVGSVDSNAVSSIQNIQNAGFGENSIDVYHFPAMDVGGKSQILDSLSNLDGTSFNRYWLDIEPFEWPDNTTKNVELIQEMVDTLKDQGQSIGFYASHRGWPEITGNTQKFGEYPLWYAHYQSPPQPNFDDWEPYGGWNSPHAKQISGSYVIEACDNLEVDLDWAPSW